jgi:hypothetical protein
LASLCTTSLDQGDIEGEDDVEEQVDVLDKEVKEVEQDVDDNVIDIL